MNRIENLRSVALRTGKERTLPRLKPEGNAITTQELRMRMPEIISSGDLAGTEENTGISPTLPLNSTTSKSSSTLLPSETLDPSDAAKADTGKSGIEYVRPEVITYPATSSDNMHELRKEMWNIMKDLRAGKLEPKVADAICKGADLILRTIKMERTK